MKNTLFTLSLLAVSVPVLYADQPIPTVTTAVQEDAKAAFAQAQKLFQEKNYKEAKQKLTQLVAKQNPMDDFIPQARLLLAKLEEDFMVSTSEFKMLAQEYNNRPEGEEAQKALGARYFLADKYNDAADSYKQFLDEHPKSASVAEVRYWFASSLLSMDKNDEAIDQYKKVISESPDSAWAPKSLLGIGNAYFKKKDYSEASKRYLEVMDKYHLYPEMNIVYFKLGETYELLQKPKEAHAAYENLVSQYPKALEASEARNRMTEIEKTHPELVTVAEAQALPTPTLVATPVPSPVFAQAVPTPTENPTPADEVLVPQPFHVQVGVYSRKVNMDKARKAIKKAGYSSYVVTARQEGVPYTYYKVRVGNFADRASAEKVAKALAKKTKEKAIVVED
jgi:TolA-binding protein